MIWGIFRSIFLSFFSPPSHPLLFFYFFLSFKSIVCLEWLVSQSLFHMIWAASKSLGCGAHRHGRGGGGVTAHRKSTKLNINPGCRTKWLKPRKTKKAIVYSCECRAAFWGGEVDLTLFLNCYWSRFLRLLKQWVFKEKQKKAKNNTCRFVEICLKVSATEYKWCYCKINRRVGVCIQHTHKGSSMSAHFSKHLNTKRYSQDIL